MISLNTKTFTIGEITVTREAPDAHGIAKVSFSGGDPSHYEYVTNLFDSHIFLGKHHKENIDYEIRRGRGQNRNSITITEPYDKRKTPITIEQIDTALAAMAEKMPNKVAFDRFLRITPDIEGRGEGRS